MRKYNPALRNMVTNYREKAKQEGISVDTYTDEELFRVIEYWSSMSTEEEQWDAVKEDLFSMIKR